MLGQSPIREFRDHAVPRPPGLPVFALPPGYAPETPVDLEIGCGVGWHPIRYARTNPGRFLIALERTHQRFASFRRRLDHHAELPNLLALQADGVAWVTHCLGRARLSRCYILYPNPHPGSPNRRWIRMPFMRRLLQSLCPGGELIFATNLPSYAAELRSEAMARWGLGLFRDQSFRAGALPSEYPRTHFEKKYLDRGETCFEIGFIRPPRLEFGLDLDDQTR